MLWAAREDVLKLGQARGGSHRRDTLFAPKGPFWFMFATRRTVVYFSPLSEFASFHGLCCARILVDLFPVLLLGNHISCRSVKNSVSKDKRHCFKYALQMLRVISKGMTMKVLKTVQR